MRGERAHLETVQKRHSSTRATKISVPKTCVRWSFTSVLLPRVRLKIVVKSAAQLEGVTFKIGGQWLEGNRCADGRHHCAVERFLSRSSVQYRLVHVNRAITIDGKRNHDDPFVSHVIGFRKNGCPVPHDDRMKPIHIALRVPTLEVGKNGHARTCSWTATARPPSASPSPDAGTLVAVGYPTGALDRVVNLILHLLTRRRTRQAQIESRLRLGLAWQQQL